MSAKPVTDSNLDIASGQIRTDDRRFTKLSSIIPNYNFTFNIVLWRSLPKTCIECRKPPGNIEFYSVY